MSTSVGHFRRRGVPWHEAVTSGNLIIAVLAAACLVLIVVGDWRTRSARSFGLLALSLALLAAFSRTHGIPAVAGFILAVLPLVPIGLNARWLAPLERTDLAMVDRISAIERALVQVSVDFRKGRLGIPDVHEKFDQIRRRAALTEAPDEAA